jgi:hypothetical protein
MTLSTDLAALRALVSESEGLCYMHSPAALEGRANAVCSKAGRASSALSRLEALVAAVGRLTHEHHATDCAQMLGMPSDPCDCGLSAVLEARDGGEG